LNCVTLVAKKFEKLVATADESLRASEPSPHIMR
jgi:hypothetical protein